MIEQNQLKPLRKVAIADHLWACFEQMAAEMGTDRDGLVNQALFMFARLNGFLVPGGGAAASAPPPGPALAAVKAPVRAAPIAPPPPEPEPEPEPEQEPDFDEAARAAEADHAEEEQSEAYEEPEPPPPPPPPAPRAPPRAPPAPPVLSGPRSARPVSDSAPPDRDEGGGSPRLFEGGAPPPKPLDEDPVRRAVAKQVLETAAELEKLIKGKNEPARPPPAAVSDSTNSGANPEEKLLYLAGDDGEMLKVGKERFLIGRGKHCDLVINSGKVSREHAAVVRDGAEFFIEDLGSSNGTWFNKQRIKRRKVEEGDEYFICSEKIRCTFR